MLFINNDFKFLYNGNVLFNVGGNPLLTWGRESCFPIHSGCSSSLYVVVLCVDNAVLCAYAVIMCTA